MGASHAGADPPRSDGEAGARTARPRSAPLPVGASPQALAGHSWLTRSRRRQGPWSRNRPIGGRSRRDRGYVTAETAVALPSLLLVSLMLMWVMSVVTAQMQCVDAARAGARVVSRGESEAVSEAAALEAAPDGAVVTITRVGDFIRVRVSLEVHPTGRLIDFLPAVEVHGDAHAIAEDALGYAATAGRPGIDGDDARLLPATAVQLSAWGGWP